MFHPVPHLVGSFCSSGAMLALLCLLAIQAQTADRQWPWIVGLILLFLLITLDYGSLSFLRDACDAGVCP